VNGRVISWEGGDSLFFGGKAKPYYFWQMKRYWIFGLLLLWLACRNEGPTTPGREQVQKTRQQRPDAPDYVWTTLAYVKAHDAAPENHVGGRTFENREKRLPQTDDHGQKIRYREWDVHPRRKGQNRGAERLITGSDQSAWFTRDHYRTFIRLE